MRDDTRLEDGALGRWRWPLACTLALAALIGFAQVAAASGPPFRVVIDAGHGGKDPGAISPLLPLTEKDVALDVALRLGAALQRRGVQVVQTRTSDRDVALAERAATAGRVGAAALVSIHLNAT
ncbi:MAG TPA: N-acetylmuramoyl-L-alanine amidase, partial [Chloroflexota bacterium]|nr:N-acetylmuramoyl-L-alanine amidase [Chloroflexota bacterium]